MKLRLFNRKAQTLERTPSFNPLGDTSVSLRASVVSDEGVEKIDLQETIAACDFDYMANVNFRIAA